MAKAALNMMATNMAHETAAQGLTTLVMCPGWVRTDMGGPGAPLDVTHSVACTLRVILAATARDNGRFLDLDGAAVPW